MRKYYVIIIILSVLVSIVLGAIIYSRYSETKEEERILLLGDSLNTAEQDSLKFAQLREDSVQEYEDTDSANEENDRDIVNTAYDRILNFLSRKNDDCWYFFFDINRDGTPELWVKTGTCEADYMLHVYTYDNGMRQIYEGGAGHSSFYSGTNYIIQICAHMGYSSWSKIYYDGKIKEKEIFSEYIEGSADDYKEPKEPFIQMKAYN